MGCTYGQQVSGVWGLPSDDDLWLLLRYHASCTSERDDDGMERNGMG
jgi:hypothetical protein